MAYDRLLCRPGAARVAALALTLALVAGCKSPGASMSAFFRDKALNNSVMEYNKFVRWQEWERATDFLKIDAQSAFTEKMEAQEETFRLTDFEIKDTRPGEGKKSAKVRVLYHYYWLPSIREQKLSVIQRWTWLEEEKRWAIENPFTYPKRSGRTPRPAAASARVDPDTMGARPLETGNGRDLTGEE